MYSFLPWFRCKKQTNKQTAIALITMGLCGLLLLPWLIDQRILSLDSSNSWNLTTFNVTPFCILLVQTQVVTNIRHWTAWHQLRNTAGWRHIHTASTTCGKLKHLPPAFALHYYVLFCHNHFPFLTDMSSLKPTNYSSLLHRNSHFVYLFLSVRSCRADSGWDRSITCSFLI